MAQRHAANGRPSPNPIFVASLSFGLRVAIAEGVSTVVMVAVMTMEVTEDTGRREQLLWVVSAFSTVEGVSSGCLMSKITKEP